MFEYYWKRRNTNVNEKLIDSAVNNNLPNLRTALLEDVDINTTREGFNALHFAVASKNFAMCEELIKRGININCGNVIGQTPLHMAILHDEVYIAELLIENNADIDRKNSYSKSPFDLALEQENIDLLKMLAKYRKDPLLKQKINHIEIAKEFFNEECKKYCEIIFSKDSLLIEPILHYVSSLESNEIKRNFINSLKKFNEKICAIPQINETSDIHKFSYFFLENYDAIHHSRDVGSHTLWFNKNHKPHPSLLALLLFLAKDPEFHVTNPIFIHEGFQDWSFFHVLMMMFSALGKIYPEEQYRFLTELSKIKAVNFNENNNKWGNTHLHFMISNALSKDCMQFIKALTLIDEVNICNLDVNTLSTKYGTAPLHLTVAKGYRDVDSWGDPTLSFLDLAEVLIAAHANVNIKSARHLGFQTENLEIKFHESLSEQTPLHIACARRDLEMITILMKHNADPSITNAEGLTALDVLNLPYEQRKCIVDSISGEDLNNFVQYEKNHSTSEHFSQCKEALSKKPVNILSAKM